MFRKMFFLFISAAVMLSACSKLEVRLDQTPTPSVDSGEVATVVAATLAASPSATIAPKITPTVEASPIPTAQCKGVLTGIVLTMPNQLWSCSASEIRPTASGGMEVINISSPIFKINTGYHVGRDSWCDPNRNKNCVVTSFYENEMVKLSLYKWDGETKEIFGYIQHSESSVMVSIKYQNMETRDLTQTEMDELVQFIKAIKFEQK